MARHSTRLDSHIQREFDDHPSLANSIAMSVDHEYETAPTSDRQSSHSPAFEMPSQHSGFRSHSVAEGSEDPEESDSAGPWSPPAWRRPGSGWFQHERLSPARSHTGSREMSPDKDITIPANVPLPRSPLKRSPSPSPEPEIKQEKQHQKAAEDEQAEESGEEDQGGKAENYFRFGANLQVQHRTDSIDMLVMLFRRQYQRITRTKTSMISFLTITILVSVILKNLFQPQNSGPGPDIIKVAGLAKSFEPLIHYSENGVQQVGDLQETGVAVWDLSESVRYSNMTSAPIIVRELDDLSESLKTLSVELTKFFANVDGDIDSILIVMEWAKRELNKVSGQGPGSIHSAYDNMYLYMHRIGGERIGSFLTELFGQTHTQLTKATLQRTFTEFLNVLEESINTELTYSTALFGLFEAIDRQFLNLQRTVLRETDSQDAEKDRKDAQLADLWRRMMGTNEARLNKYKKNKQLLASIKERTVHNKLILVDHNGKLLKLKSNLEILRKRLVSPLVRSNQSSTLTVAEQIEGLDGTYEYLRAARERQKSKLMERLYGVGSRNVGVTIGDDRAIGEL